MNRNRFTEIEVTWRVISGEEEEESSRYKIDTRRLRTVWEMEKPKNFYV